LRRCYYVIFLKDVFTMVKNDIAIS